MYKKLSIIVSLLAVASIVLSSCANVVPTATPAPKLKVRVLIDSNSENDKGFNQYTLEGARKASKDLGLDFGFVAPESAGDYERQVDKVAAEGPNLIITVGFRMGNATAKAASKYPNIKFAIVDTAYYPGAGCPDTAKDCYTTEGGLPNVTSLMFAEDEIAYLAGVLAACMSKTGTIGTVAGIEIPPVVRFVKGFQNGAKSVNPAITTLNRYIPDFNDPATGKIAGQDFISKGADVIFGAGGATGNGGLLAAKEAGIMAIGVDVDQYYSYPEVNSALLTSASKHVDVAAAATVWDFAAGKLKSGIRLSTLSNGGVDLAPYHDWDTKISQSCKDKVESARSAIIADPTVTGAK
jgi:basic membrane protein A and related proteins